MTLLLYDLLARPIYYFNGGRDFFEVEEGSNPTLRFLVSSNPRLCDNAEHEVRKLNGDPVTRFPVSNNCITIYAVEMEDAGKYLIKCKNDDGASGEKAFEIKVTRSKVKQ